MTKKNKLYLIVLLLIFALIVFEARVGNAESNEPNRDIVRLAFSSKLLNDANYADAQAALELWIREFSSSSTLKVQSKPLIFENLQSLETALKSGEVNVVGFPVTDYLKIKDKALLEPSLVAVRKGSADGERLVLIVRKDRRISDISELKGKKLLVHQGYMVDAAYLWLDTLLDRKHLPTSERFFGSVREVKKVPGTVLPLFFNQADAALVNKNAFETMVDLNPQLGEKLTILSVSDKLVYGIFCMSKGLTENSKKLMIQNALIMHKMTIGKQILTLFQIDDVIPFKPHLLDPTIELFNKAARRQGNEVVRRRDQ
ncbi:MAG TPA: PhnD/SsuA/transferrin family substrate-binding protein [Dissulfurispiraceae bacterium]|nr:PhnD/SsuA/transferrin family substrate-binding protein [Dissulfurispiraceae bacterium]